MPIHSWPASFVAGQQQSAKALALLCEFADDPVVFADIIRTRKTAGEDIHSRLQCLNSDRLFREVFQFRRHAFAQHLESGQHRYDPVLDLVMGLRQAVDLWSQFPVALKEDSTEELAVRLDVRNEAAMYFNIVGACEPLAQARQFRFDFDMRTYIHWPNPVNRRRHTLKPGVSQVLTIKDLGAIRFPCSREMPMSKNNFSSLIAVTALALIGAPVGLNRVQDTSIPVAEGRTEWLRLDQ
jgi:hypothetical protein